jgi:hypothetical protein
MDLLESRASKSGTGTWLVAILVAIVASAVSIAITATILQKPDSPPQVTQKSAPPRAANISAQQKSELLAREKRMKDSEQRIASKEAELTQREKQVAELEAANRFRDDDRPAEAPAIQPKPPQPPDVLPFPDDELDAEEIAQTVDQHIVTLHTDPDPNARASAASVLTQFPDKADKTVPAYQKALTNEVAPEVIEAVLHSLASLQSKARPATASLVTVVKTTRIATHRRLAFEALVAIDRTSSEVKSILTTAILGTTGKKAVVASYSSVIHQNREYACDALAQLGADGSWAVPLLIEAYGVTAKDIDRKDHSHHRLIEKIATALVAISPTDNRSYECLKQMRLALSVGNDSTTPSAVHVDSAIKEMEQARRKKAKE